MALMFHAVQGVEAWRLCGSRLGPGGCDVGGAHLGVMDWVMVILTGCADTQVSNKGRDDACLIRSVCAAWRRSLPEEKCS